MSAPLSVHRLGNEWTITWPGVRLIISRIHDSSHGDLRATLVVERNHQGAGWIHAAGPTSVNLIAIEGQERTANAIAKRAGENGVYWFDLIASACTIVHAQWQQPPPVVGAQLAAARAEGPVDWVLPGLILAGETSMLYGDGASAKSLIALLIAVAVALGVELPWGARPTRRMRVLYADWETNDVTFGRRLRRVCEGLGVAVPADEDLAYMGTISGDPDAPVLGLLSNEVDSLRRYISRARIGLVVVDSVGFMLNGKLSDDDVARQAINNLRLLGGGVTRLAVHHVSRDSALRVGNQRVDPFGSIYFRNGARSGFEVRKFEEHSTRDEMRLGIFQHKANDGALGDPFALKVHFATNGTIQFERADLTEVTSAAEGRAPLQQQILEVLGSYPNGLVARTIAHLIGRTDRNGEDSVRMTLQKLQKSGQVIQLRPGVAGQPAVWGLAPVSDVPEPFRGALDDLPPDPEEDD